MHGGGTIVEIYHQSDHVRLMIADSKYRSLRVWVEIGATNYVLRIGDTIFWNDEKQEAFWMSPSSDMEKELLMRKYYERRK